MSLFFVSLCLLLFSKIYPFIIQKISNKENFLSYTLIYAAICLLIALTALKFIRPDYTIGQIVVSIIVALIAFMSIGGNYFSLKKQERI